MRQRRSQLLAFQSRFSDRSGEKDEGVMFLFTDNQIANERQRGGFFDIVGNPLP